MVILNKKTYIPFYVVCLLVLIFSVDNLQSAVGTHLSEYKDVTDTKIEGDSTLMGMSIESAYYSENSFLIETTGARYEYVKGCLKLYQGLQIESRRFLAEFQFENEPNFITLESTDDHILLWSKNINIGIYGDSTLIISPQIKQTLRCDGHFKPDYVGRRNGELLLIDDTGGMEIYPQRYEAGYQVSKIELEEINWSVEYKLNKHQRVMIAAFPGRPFDWEKSFKSNWLSTCGSMGLGQGNIYGQLPSDNTIRIWSQNFHIVNVFFNGLYKEDNPYGPYEVANAAEFERFLRTAHQYDLKVIPYGSLFYWLRKRHGDYEGFYEQIKTLRDQFQIDGIYIDGLGFDHGPYHRQESRIDNWETIRKLRQLFGKEGVIIMHDTQGGQTTGTVPNIDVYCDLTLNGENVEFNSLNDNYINYQVRKYGISNTIGVWKTGKHPSRVTQKQIIDKTLQMNGRCRMGAFVKTKEPPPMRKPFNGKYIWPTKLNSEYGYYLNKLEFLKNRHELSRSR